MILRRKDFDRALKARGITGIGVLVLLNLDCIQLIPKVLRNLRNIHLKNYDGQAAEKKEDNASLNFI